MVNSSKLVPTLPSSCCNLTVDLYHDPLLLLATAIIGANTEITVIRCLYNVRWKPYWLLGVKYCNQGVVKLIFAQLKACKIPYNWYPILQVQMEGKLSPSPTFVVHCAMAMDGLHYSLFVYGTSLVVKSELYPEPGNVCRLASNTSFVDMVTLRLYGCGFSWDCRRCYSSLRV